MVGIVALHCILGLQESFPHCKTNGFSPFYVSWARGTLYNSQTIRSIAFSSTAFRGFISYVYTGGEYLTARVSCKERALKYHTQPPPAHLLSPTSSRPPPLAHMIMRVYENPIIANQCCSCLIALCSHPPTSHEGPWKSSVIANQCCPCSANPKNMFMEHRHTDWDVPCKTGHMYPQPTSELCFKEAWSSLTSHCLPLM